MRIENDVKLDFDNVLIRPKRSDAPSRKSIDLIRTFKMPHAGLNFTCLPILAANLDTTGTMEMGRALAKHHACCCLHKFYSAIDLVEYFNQPYSFYSFYTLGLREEDSDKLKEVDKHIAIKMLCLDAANGYTKYFVRKLQELRQQYPTSIIMAGNVCTSEMIQELILEGADIVKVGIGPGSHCTTRQMTGVGYAQLSAIIECADAAHGLGGLIVADGGCRTPGDVAKAFGGGADFVMLGGMLAGTDECDGEWTDEGLKVYGMSSTEAQEKYYDGVPDYATSEGRCSIVPRKGPVENTVKEITGGLRSMCSYIGAKELKDVSKCTTFVRIK